MRNNRSHLAAAVLLSTLIFSHCASACTNFLITRGASTDGSVIITYSADSHTLYGELYHWPAARYLPGAKLKVYE